MSTETTQKNEDPSTALLKSLFGFMSTRTKMSWKANAGAWEGETDKIFVRLEPHQETKVRASLVKKANAKFAEVAKIARRVHGVRLTKKVPVQLKQPTKKSGMHIYDARIRGLHHLGDSVLYQITAKNIDDAKIQAETFVYEAKVRQIASVLRKVSANMNKSSSDTVMLALNELAKTNEIDLNAKRPVTLPSGRMRVQM